ncbi:GUN4 domain-containing protein [Dolichospermum planctonicum UHCC 0167]|uniref:GUN4 domain-containing protein n=1 Tax=Dolichospermum planctonicum TaxID=136072 RepID=UPI0014437E86|nr:GUN4 domain-containing protein [Dolichospermum planctonicum]MCW9682763.1 GUN4 domain-containing protein [Dolichospermum planctonicum UHCC 0167]
MHIEFLVEEASTEIALKQIVPKIIGNKLFLVDFGAVKVVKPQQRTATGTIIGSAEYCAPEQSMGKPLFISDLYSLGVTCLHLLTGISPFDLYSPLEGEWVWRDYLNGNVVSDKLGKILDKLAHPIPKHRYQSIPEVINEFNSVHQNINLVSCLAVPQLPVPSGYQKLKQFLEASKWKEADEETFRIMLAVTQREKEGWLDETSIDNFPCDDLRTIDDLWIKYSNGRFGFSVQNQIYQGLGGTRKYNDEIWAAFGDKVGWRQGERRLWYKDVTFNIFAPQGHLPARFWDDWDGKGVGGGSRSIGRVTSLLLRLVNCNI